MNKLISVFLVFALTFTPLMQTFAQLGGPRELREITAKPDEMISMTQSLPFNQAIEIFSELSKLHLGKLIIDTQGIVSPIGVDIENMHWLDAFEMILKSNDLWYDEFPSHVQITSITDQGVSLETINTRELFLTREVTISAIFFEVDLNKARSLGMNWRFWDSDSLQSVSMSAGAGTSPILDINWHENVNDNDNLVLGLKALESRQAGEVLASPSVTVRSKKEGRIQIGSDYTVTTQDFAGNTVNQFFSTGSIIKVKPEIFTVDSTTFIHLELDVQKSSANPAGALGIEIQKSSATSSILLLDGEETVIGGLFANEESNSREGIPFLKDLPWWFFGLRYIFGYETRSVVRKELVILLRAELVPTLSERIELRKLELDPDDNKLLDRLKGNDQNIEKYRKQSKKSR